MLYTFLFVLLSLAASQVSAFPNGAPRSACGSLRPIHMLFSAKEDDAPFAITVSPTKIAPGQTVTVTLRSLGDTEFKGYIIQARDGDEAVGEFEVPNKEDGKTLDCPGGEHNAVTHSSRDKKTSATFRWTAPEDFSGSVTFTGTVVVGFRTFYNEVVSSAVTVA